MLRLYAASLLLEKNHISKHILRTIMIDGDEDAAIYQLYDEYDNKKWSVRDIDIDDITDKAEYVVDANTHSSKEEPPEAPPVKLNDPIPIGFMDECGEVWSLADRVVFKDLKRRVAAIEDVLKGKGP